MILLFLQSMRQTMVRYNYIDKSWWLCQKVSYISSKSEKQFESYGERNKLSRWKIVELKLTTRFVLSAANMFLWASNASCNSLTCQSVMGTEWPRNAKCHFSHLGRCPYQKRNVEMGQRTLCEQHFTYFMGKASTSLEDKVSISLRFDLD